MERQQECRERKGVRETLSCLSGHIAGAFRAGLGTLGCLSQVAGPALSWVAPDVVQLVSRKRAREDELYFCVSGAGVFVAEDARCHMRRQARFSGCVGRPSVCMQAVSFGGPSRHRVSEVYCGQRASRLRSGANDSGMSSG